MVAVGHSRSNADMRHQAILQQLVKAGFRYPCSFELMSIMMSTPLTLLFITACIQSREAGAKRNNPVKKVRQSNKKRIQRRVLRTPYLMSDTSAKWAESRNGQRPLLANKKQSPNTRPGSWACTEYQTTGTAAMRGVSVRLGCRLVPSRLVGGSFCFSGGSRAE